MNNKLRLALFPAFLVLASGAFAQVRMSELEYKPAVPQAAALPIAGAGVNAPGTPRAVQPVTVGADLPVIAAPVPAPKQATYEVLASDRTIREVLQRWAKATGWSHEQSHWTLTRDFPVEGTASADYFKGDFKEAVRTLLSSTLGGDLPAQPCFYTNHIVRVVPLAELCDRSVAVSQ